ncbi:MAG: MFS transporter [bacterium]|nr:MFS transporter [bacterium]MCY3890041.1 MFS transporter [bacterium]
MADRSGFRASTRALRLRNFRLFWFGALVSNTGTWMQILVLAYVIDEITDRGAWVGLVAITQMVMTVFANLWAGPLADRVPRRSIILVTQSLLCVGAFGFAALWGRECARRLSTCCWLGATGSSTDSCCPPGSPSSPNWCPKSCS